VTALTTGDPGYGHAGGMHPAGCGSSVLGVEISGQLGRAMLEVMDLSFTRAGNDMDVRLELGNPSALLIQALNQR
jgi:hypothetical protein